MASAGLKIQPKTTKPIQLEVLKNLKISYEFTREKWIYMDLLQLQL